MLVYMDEITPPPPAVYLAHCQVAETPFHNQGDGLYAGWDDRLRGSDVYILVQKSR